MNWFLSQYILPKYYIPNVGYVLTPNGLFIAIFGIADENNINIKPSIYCTERLQFFLVFFSRLLLNNIAIQYIVKFNNLLLIYIEQRNISLNQLTFLHHGCSEFKNVTFILKSVACSDCTLHIFRS